MAFILAILVWVIVSMTIANVVLKLVLWYLKDDGGFDDVE